MRRLTQREKDYINKMVDSYPSFSVYVFFVSQNLHSSKDLLELSFLLWFLEDNGYVYVSQNAPKYFFAISDLNLNRYVNSLYDSLRERVSSLLMKDVYITDQLRLLRENNYQSIEEEQLNLSKQLLENALIQTKEAKAQSDEALKQTNEALNQTVEARAQTQQALNQTKEAQKQTFESKAQTQQALDQTEQAKVQTQQALDQTEQAKVQTQRAQDQLEESIKQTKYARWTFYASFVTLIVSSLIAAIPIIRPSQPGSSVPDNTGIIDSLCLKTDYEKRIDSVSINVPKDSSLFKIAVSDSDFINQNQQ